MECKVDATFACLLYESGSLTKNCGLSSAMLTILVDGNHLVRDGREPQRCRLLLAGKQPLLLYNQAQLQIAPEAIT